MEERILTWNLPNVISVWLMIIILWTATGILSHMLFRKGKSTPANTQKPGVSYSGSLSVVA